MSLQSQTTPTATTATTAPRKRQTMLFAILMLSWSSYNCKANSIESKTVTRSSSSISPTSPTSRVKHPIQHPKAHLESLPKIAPLLGESAIIDKETGRVFWQGGEQSLFHSTVGHTYFRNSSGLTRHVRSTLYSFILWISVIKFLTRKILESMDYIIQWLDLNDILMMQRLRGVIKNAIRLLRIFIVCLACLPQFSRNFIVLVGIFYIIESYTCSTRKYLDNIMTPEKVETYLEDMQMEKPCVKWDIRCFHYEKRKLLCMLLMVDLWKMLYNVLIKKSEREPGEGEGDIIILQPSILTKKVVTHQKSQYYKFNSWEDETIGGLWKQSEASTSMNSDFIKISMYKLILLANSKAKSDYFLQQSKFVSNEGQKDAFAELSTKVEVQGYKKKILVKKRKNWVSKLFSRQCYWLFTLLLLTVPFRIQFARRCDELHITLAKETSTDIKQDSVSAVSPSSSWFTSPKNWFTFMSFSSTESNKDNEDTSSSKSSEDQINVEIETNEKDSESKQNIISDVQDTKSSMIEDAGGQDKNLIISSNDKIKDGNNNEVVDNKDKENET